MSGCKICGSDAKAVNSGVTVNNLIKASERLEDKLSCFYPFCNISRAKLKALLGSALVVLNLWCT